MTTRDLIKGSLRLLGVLAAGETPSAEDAADALSSLNDMLDSWSTENLMVYARVREEFALTAGQASYTMGSSGNFITTRPVKIEVAKLETQNSSPTTEYPIQIVTQAEWADIRAKDLQSEIPTHLYPEGTFPSETLNLYPVPTTAHKLVLYSWKPFSSFSSLNDSVSFPPGYAKLLRYGLAIELAPEYEREPSALILSHFSEARANIKIMNSRPVYLDAAAAVYGSGKPYDINTGE